MELFGIFDEINDDNVLSTYKLTKGVLDEIHKVSERFPFENFSELYDYLDNNRVRLPDIYESFKEKTEPSINKSLKEIQELKVEALNRVDNIGNYNQELIEKSRLIVGTGFDYFRDSIDEMVIAGLDKYTQDTTILKN